MFEKSQIIAHAVRAELPEEFCRELSDYLDFVYANPDVHTAMAEYYEKQKLEIGDEIKIGKIVLLYR